MTASANSLLHAIVHPADIQDRDGGILVMATLFGTFPFLKKLFAELSRTRIQPSFGASAGFATSWVGLPFRDFGRNHR